MLYNLLKFVHVASIAVWFGGLVTMLVLSRVFAAAGDASLMQGFGKHAGAMTHRLFMPAMLVTLITGIGLVQAGNLSFGSAWIQWGIIGLVISVVLGGVLTGRASRKLGEQIARGEIDAAGAAAARKRIQLFVILNLLVLLSLIWAMVAKPD